MVVGGVLTSIYVYPLPEYELGQINWFCFTSSTDINNRRRPDELTQRHLSLFQVNKVWCQAKLYEFAYYKAELIANQQFMDLTVLIR